MLGRYPETKAALTVRRVCKCVHPRSKHRALMVMKTVSQVYQGPTGLSSFAISHALKSCP